ncbi:MAG TPA: hypothetical protein VK829_10735, partial [Terriglobales bacterium]|nr:hypothetical protein [Terriglobales bacterium]
MRELVRLMAQDDLRLPLRNMTKPRLAPDDRKWNNHSRSNLEHDAAIVRAAQAGGAVEVFAGLV